MSVGAPQYAVRLDADGLRVEEVTVDYAFERPEEHEEVVIDAGLGIMSESMFAESMVNSVIENKPEGEQPPAAAAAEPAPAPAAAAPPPDPPASTLFFLLFILSSYTVRLTTPP